MDTRATTQIGPFAAIAKPIAIPTGAHTTLSMFTMRRLHSARTQLALFMICMNAAQKKAGVILFIAHPATRIDIIPTSCTVWTRIAVPPTTLHAVQKRANATLSPARRITFRSWVLRRLIVQVGHAQTTIRLHAATQWPCVTHTLVKTISSRSTML